jgi:hypothetical protein
MPSASEGERRIISFAGSAVAVAWDEPRGARIVRFLFEHAPARDDIAPCETFRIGWIEHSAKLGLYRGDILIYLGDSEGYLAELLMNEVCRHLVTHSRGGLLLHAAGLAHDGKGIILPGAMTTGKSTLAAWLALRGLDYLTDELVFIPQGAEEMQPFIRPLNLRRPSRAALPELGWQTLAPGPWPGRESDLIPPKALNPAGRWASPALRVIVFARYAPHATPAVRRLSQAETALALLPCLVNSSRLPEGGLPEVARIARQVRGYEAVYGHLSQLHASLEDWGRAL